jgi:hypothetical protein
LHTQTFLHKATLLILPNPNISPKFRDSFTNRLDRRKKIGGGFDIFLGFESSASFFFVFPFRFLFYFGFGLLVMADDAPVRSFSSPAWFHAFRCMGGAAVFMGSGWCCSDLVTFGVVLVGSLILVFSLCCGKRWFGLWSSGDCST